MKLLALCVPWSPLKRTFLRDMEKTFLNNIFNDQIKLWRGKVAKVPPVLLTVKWTHLSPFFSCSQREGKPLKFYPRIILLKFNISWF